MNDTRDMGWPIAILPSGLRDEGIAVVAYSPGDAEELFGALDDPLTWEHIPYPIPSSAKELGDRVLARIAGGARLTFTIRLEGVVVGTSSVLFEAGRPESVEIGGTRLAPAVWGSGVNGWVKRLLTAAIEEAGFTAVVFRMDERNGRSAAAIPKLGAIELGVRQDVRVRRDGSVRASRLFRLDLPRGNDE